MTIQQNRAGADLTISLTGRMDTMTAPELEKELKSALEGVENLTIDLGALDYISSAGLRVLLSAQKLMSRRGGMTLTHVGDAVMEIFEVTGFVDILTIA